MSNVKVIRLGLGEVVSNWGTHGGVPAIFIEPTKDHGGEVGRVLREGEQPHIKQDAVSDGAVIIELHNAEGFDVVVEDGKKALGRVAPESAPKGNNDAQG